MPDTKISADTELTTADGTEFLPVVKGGNNKMKISTLKAYVQTDRIRSTFSLSGGANVFPSTGGSGPSGAIKQFDQFLVPIGGAGNLPTGPGGTGEFTAAGMIMLALVDTPGNDSTKWKVY